MSSLPANKDSDDIHSLSPPLSFPFRGPSANTSSERSQSFMDISPPGSVNTEVSTKPESHDSPRAQAQLINEDTQGVDGERLQNCRKRNYEEDASGTQDSDDGDNQVAGLQSESDDDVKPALKRHKLSGRGGGGGEQIDNGGGDEIEEYTSRRYNPIYGYGGYSGHKNMAHSDTEDSDVEEGFEQDNFDSSSDNLSNIGNVDKYGFPRSDDEESSIKDSGSGESYDMDKSDSSEVDSYGGYTGQEYMPDEDVHNQGLYYNPELGHELVPLYNPEALYYSDSEEYSDYEGDDEGGPDSEEEGDDHYDDTDGKGHLKGVDGDPRGHIEYIWSERLQREVQVFTPATGRP